MRLAKNDWPSTENAARYKLFAELVVELVHANSWESYRAHALSTITKARELLIALSKVSRREIPKPAIEPIVEEFRYSLESDPVVKRIFSEKGISMSSFLLYPKDSTGKIENITRLFFEISSENYQAECQNIVKETCLNKGSKGELITATKLWVSHVLNSGYSKEYLFFTARDIFFSNSIGRCTQGLLDRFFRKFSGKTRNFSLYLATNKRYANLLSNQLGFSVYRDASELPGAPIAGFPDHHGAGEHKRIIHFGGRASLDPHTAAGGATLLLALVTSILYLHPRNVKTRVDNRIVVMDEKTKALKEVELSRSFMPRKVSESAGEHKSSVAELARYAFALRRKRPQEAMDAEGHRRIVSSLNSVSLASKTDDKESQLLSIWSAFEAILPEPSKDDERNVRILHYSSLIVPCVSHGYLCNVFAECYRNCVQEFGSDIVDFVDANGVGSSSHRKFSSLFLASEPIQREFCRIVSESPLMLNRFFRLQKLLLEPKAAVSYYKTHESRVMWQVHRIYRERNSIVHKAETSPFLSDLVENAYSYYRSVVLTLEKIYSKHGILFPDQSLELAKAISKEYLRELEEISSKRDLPEHQRRESFLAVMFERCVLR